MSAAITDADLDALEAQLRESATEPETPNVSAQLALTLVAEVRRTRAENLSLVRRVAALDDAIRIGIVERVESEPRDSEREA